MTIKRVNSLLVPDFFVVPLFIMITCRYNKLGGTVIYGASHLWYAVYPSNLALRH